MKDDLRLRQVCLAAAALAPLDRDLSAILRTPICHRDPAVGAYGLENALFAAGPAFIEIVAPRQPNTAIHRFLERSGGTGGYMAIFECADPTARRRHAEATGIAIAHEVRHDSYHGVQLHPRDCRGAMIEFNHTDGGGALYGPYAPAGPRWQEFLGPDSTQSLFAIELTSPTPFDLARHWSRLLSMPLGGSKADPALEIGETKINFSSTAAGSRERLSAVTLALADPETSLREAARRGYAVSNDCFFAAGVDFRLMES